MAQYRERLYWHIRRIVLVHEDADDVLQNTFIKIYRGILQFEGKSKLYTWLYRIATNEAITHLQSISRHASASLDDQGSSITGRLHADEWFDGDEIQVRLKKRSRSCLINNALCLICVITTKYPTKRWQRCSILRWGL